MFESVRRQSVVFRLNIKLNIQPWLIPQGTTMDTTSR